MSNFTLENIPQVNGRIPFYKLSIHNRCLFDEFCDEIERYSQLRTQLFQAFSRMNDVADLKRLPKNKLRDITPAKERIKEFEIKTKDLRIYIIKEQGHIIILGGRKSTQSKDINRFRRIKAAYLEFRNQNIQ